MTAQGKKRHVKRQEFTKNLDKLIEGHHVLIPKQMPDAMRLDIVQAVFGPFNEHNLGGQPCYCDEIAPKANHFVNQVLPKIWHAMMKHAMRGQHEN